MEKTLELTTKKPFFEADDSLKTLYPLLKDLVNTLEEIQTYYETDGYLEDNFAKGKELHRKIYNQYIAYHPAKVDFESHMSILAKEYMQKELVKFKRNDYMISYYSLNIIEKINDIMLFLNQQADAENNMKDFDVIKEKYSLLLDDIDKFLYYSSDDARIEKEGFGSRISELQLFSSTVKNFKSNLGSVFSILEEKNPSMDKQPWETVVENGGLQFIVNLHRENIDIVNSYNNMLDDKKMIDINSLQK